MRNGRENTESLAADGVEVRKTHESVVIEFLAIALFTRMDNLLPESRLDFWVCC